MRTGKDRLPSIEATVGHETDFDVLHVRPAEALPTPWEPPIDNTSLAVQKVAKKMGLKLPDLRFRIMTNPNTDDIHGTHFGTLEGAVEKATTIRQQGKVLNLK